MNAISRSLHILQPPWLHVVMDDGSEEEFGPGDVLLLPPGHDAWVVGQEPVVVVDVSGMRDYAEGER